MKKIFVCVAALLATLAGCGGDDEGSPGPGGGGSSGGGSSGDGAAGSGSPGTEDDDLEDCRASLPAWTAARELVTDGGALSDFTIVDGRIYYAAGTEFYGDGFPAAGAEPEELLSGYPSINFFVTQDYVGFGSGPVPMQQITLLPRAGGAPLDRPIEAKAWATQRQYHAGTDSIYGRVTGGDNYRYFVHEVSSGDEQIIETTSPSDLDGATLMGDHLYATRETDGQPMELFRFTLGGTEAEAVPVDIESFAVLLKDSNSLYLRGQETGELVNRYYRLPAAGGTAESLELGDEGLAGVYLTSRGLIFNTQAGPGQPVNVRLVEASGTQPVELWSTTFDCRSRGMVIDGDNLYVGLQPNARDWVVTIPLANLEL